MGQLIFSPQAVDELQSIYKYIKRNSPLNALRVRDKIVNQSEKLLINPTAGRVVINAHSFTVRQIMVYRYRIFNKLDGENIQIISIFHSSRLMDNNPGLQDLFEE